MTDGRETEIALNRAVWAVVNARFTDAAAEDLWTRPGIVWGLFASPEEELGALGDVKDLDVVELACGTAYFSAWLAHAGAAVVAVDLSEKQLATARRLQHRFGPHFPLVQADAERIPLSTGRFDLVVSEHGVAAWCDPDRWLPEARRLLRPGGRLVFLTNSNLSALCVPTEEGVAGDRLLRGQRDAYRVQWPGGGIEFHPSHGDWIRLLRGSGFALEAMHEIYAPPDQGDHPFYEIVTSEWAARWPAEELVGGDAPLIRHQRPRWSVLWIAFPDALRHRAHHLEGEHRRLVDQVDEGLVVDDGEDGRLGRDGGQAARRVVDEGELAEGVAGLEEDAIVWSPLRSSPRPEMRPYISVPASPSLKTTSSAATSRCSLALMKTARMPIGLIVPSTANSGR